MFKRKPTTQPRTPIQTYKITLPAPTTSPSKASNPLLPQRHLLITRTLPTSPSITYSLTITTTSLPSLSEFELLLHNTSTTNNATTTAKTQVSLSNNQTDLFFNEKTQKIEMNLTSNWKYKNYSTSLLLPPGYSNDSSQSKEIELLWKGTNDVKGFSRKLDRGMNHKLVEKNSNRVLARYIRDPGVGDLAGVVEIFEGVEIKGWDVFILVSAFVVAEKTFRCAMRMYGVRKVPKVRERKKATVVGVGGVEGGDVDVDVDVDVDMDVDVDVAEVLEGVGAFGF